MLAIQKTHEEEVDDDTLLQNEKFRLKYYMGVSRYLRIKYYLAILEKKLQKIKNKTNSTEARYYGGFFTCVATETTFCQKNQLKRSFCQTSLTALDSLFLST